MAGSATKETPMSNNDEYTRPFSEGEQVGADDPENQRVARFSEGQQVLGGESEKHHVGRFSEGEEVLGEEDPEKHRAGSFADEDL
jgi:hypothetical protein